MSSSTDDRGHSEASSDAGNLAANSSNETLAVACTRPVAVISRPGIDNATKRRKLRLQLAEDEDGVKSGNARSLECCVPSDETFPKASCDGTSARSMELDAVEEGIMSANVVAETYNNRQSNGPNSGDVSFGESTVAVKIPRIAEHEVPELPNCVQTASQASQRSIPGAFAVLGIDQIDGEEAEDDYESLDFANADIETTMVNLNSLHQHDIMVEANVVDEAAEEAEREETMNLRIETTSLRYQLEQLKDENLALRDGERTLGACIMMYGRIVTLGCAFLLLVAMLILLLILVLASKRTTKHNDSNLTPSPTTITFESPQAVPPLQRSYTSRPSLQSSMWPSTPPSIWPSMPPSIWPSTPSSIRSSTLPSIWPSTPPSIRSSSLPFILPSTPPSIRSSSLPFILPSTPPSIRPSMPPSTWPSTPPSIRQSAPPSTNPYTPSSMPSTNGPLQWASIANDVIGNDPGDWLGYHVDISGNGNRIAVVPYHDSINKQHVRLYELTANTTITQSTWTQMGDDIINATDVAMDESGNTIVVGNRNSDTVTTYTWDMSTNEWNQFGTALAGYGSPTVLSLSSDGRQLAIGDANSEGHREESLDGQVIVYMWDAADVEWIPMGDAIVGDISLARFGTSVSLSGDGNRIVVGADRNNGFGILQVFEWSREMSLWKQHGQTITGNTEATSNELFGHDFEMSRDGTTIVVGASLSSQGGSFSGRAVVYRWDENSNLWTQLGAELIGKDAYDRFGSSVSISSNGNRIAIGAYSNFGENLGHVRVFDWNGSIWTQVGDDVNGDAINDYFGWSIGLSNDGTRMVVGAIWHDCPTDDDDEIDTRCGLVRAYDANSQHLFS